jgi:hypothetical protein
LLEWQAASGSKRYPPLAEGKERRYKADQEGGQRKTLSIQDKNKQADGKQGDGRVSRQVTPELPVPNFHRNSLKIVFGRNPPVKGPLSVWFVVELGSLPLPVRVKTAPRGAAELPSAIVR